MSNESRITDEFLKSARFDACAAIGDKDAEFIGCLDWCRAFAEIVLRNEHGERPNIVRQQFPDKSAQKPFEGAFLTMPLPVNVFTEQQRYAVSQLYGAVKFGGYPYHDNSRIAEALVTVADMLSTTKPTPNDPVQTGV